MREEDWLTQAIWPMPSGRFWSRYCLPRRLLGNLANGRCDILSRRPCICFAAVCASEAATMLSVALNCRALALPLAPMGSDRGGSIDKAAVEQRCGINVLRIHQHCQPLDRCEDHGLFPCGKLVETLHKGRLQ